MSLSPIACPRCGTKVPHSREPNSLRQELWGGWTCSECGIEMDRNGTELNIRRTVEPIPTPFNRDGKSPIERAFEDER